MNINADRIVSFLSGVLVGLVITTFFVPGAVKEKSKQERISEAMEQCFMESLKNLIVGEAIYKACVQGRKAIIETGALPPSFLK